jgi:hypothetical protein
VIELRLQRKIGPIWFNYGPPTEWHGMPDDAEPVAVHWLAEVYAIPRLVDWPGPYRVEMYGDGISDPDGEIGNGIVTINHPAYEEALAKQRALEQDREVETHCEARRGR